MPFCQLKFIKNKGLAHNPHLYLPDLTNLRNKRTESQWEKTLRAAAKIIHNGILIW
jgi:hypothetical protein